MVTYVYKYDSYECLKKRERDETMRALFKKHTHKTHISTTLQMKSKVAYIVSYMSLKRLSNGLGLGLGFFGL